MSGRIAILIDAKLHNELVLRTGKVDDVSHYIEHALERWLEQSKDKTEIGSPGHRSGILGHFHADHLLTFGDPKRGYVWSPIVLPNGTKLKMTYKERTYYAEVRHQKIMDGKSEHSPSEWASKNANNTSRNAWRDIYIQLPDSSEWKLAEVMRREFRESIEQTLESE